MNKICLGCGSILQTTKVSEKGYTLDLKNTYCKRCFRLKNYGEKVKEDYINNEDILKKINSKNGLVFFLIDFLNLNKETIQIFKSIKLPKVLLVSKFDTMRLDMKKDKIRNWLKHVYKINDNIYFISGKNNYAEINIFKYLEKNNYKTAYIMGITNAGKSTFLNNILKEYHINKEVVVSKYQNTTLDFIKFNINDFRIYDTPGFLYECLDDSLLNKEIKPISLSINKPMTISINKYYFYFKEPNKIILYLSNNNYQKSFKEDKGEEVLIQKNSDIVLPGLGFLNVKIATTIKTNGSNLEIRPNYSDFGGNYE